MMFQCFPHACCLIRLIGCVDIWSFKIKLSHTGTLRHSTGRLSQLAISLALPLVGDTACIHCGFIY